MKINKLTNNKKEINRSNAIKIITAIEKKEPIKFSACTGKDFKEILDYINRYIKNKNAIENI
ncbi:hypothetical protein [Gilliamella sp. BG7]|uniref:hypothetical protein n=1 Tax=unclassified Gilliamella TaxID=2685620 RepID=UPI003985C73C